MRSYFSIRRKAEYAREKHGSRETIFIVYQTDNLYGNLRHTLVLMLSSWMPSTFSTISARMRVVVMVQGEDPALDHAGRNVVEKILERFLLDLLGKRIEYIDLALPHHERVDGPRVLARHIDPELQGP